MKKLLRHTLCLAIATMTLFACKPDEPTPTPEEAMHLKSQSIAEGAEIDAFGVTELVLTYDKMIKLSSTAKVTINGLEAAPVVSSVTAKIPLALTPGETYKVEATEGSFVSTRDAAVVSPAFSLTFTTKAAGSTDSIAAALCNPNATKEAKNVYNFLCEQYGKKIISSSIANVNWNFAEAELVYKATGKYPAMATMDYIHMFTMTSHNPFSGWVVPYNNITEVKKWWDNNGLLSACWHWNMPANKEAINNKDGYTCTPGAGTVGSNVTTCVKPSDIMNPDSWVYAVAQEDLQKMVEVLKLLQDAGIPMIWRPFHEASGNTYGQYAGSGAWFWWGAEGAAKYKELWQYVYNYFKDNGINNLIWVWTSQNNGDTDWYPGDEYVDIVGQDIYNQNAVSNASDYIRLKSTYPNKLCTLSECGNVGKISEQWAAGARWSYFMPWYDYNATSLDGHQHGNTEWWQDAVNCQYVITRDQMPSLK